MKKILLLSFICIAFWSCNTNSTTQSTEKSPNDSIQPLAIDNSIEKTTAKTPHDTLKFFFEDALACNSYEGLVKKYGEVNLRKNAKIPGAEGIETDGTLLFPDADDELQIFWKEGNKFKEIESVISNARFGRDDKLSFYTHWQLKNGLKVGKKLSDVVKINQKTFTMSGFDWDYGGYVVSWEGGKLADKGISVRFTNEVAENKLSEQETNSVAGDTEFNVSLPVIKKMNPLISQITLSKPVKAVQ